MKPQLILLHGALGSKKQFIPLIDTLKTDFNVHTLDFSGHGGLALPAGDFSIELFANDVVVWMDSNNISSIHIFGYSMGGYVALYMAKHFPERVLKVFTLATKFDWSETIAEKEIKMLNPDKIEEKVPAFAKTLAERHAPQDWKHIMLKAAEMMRKMGGNNPMKESDYLSTTQPAVIAVGEDDNMVTRDETVNVSRLLRNASFLSLEDTEHPIEKADLYKLTREMKQFFISK